MGSNLFAKAGVVTLVLVFVFLLFWEFMWRNHGFTPDPDDNAALWANTRKKAYLSPEKSTVFIGSSRIKFDLDQPTWRKLTGEEAVQLAIEGSSPFLLLQDLAGDEKFIGKLIIDVTEPLYFSNAPFYAAKPKEYTHYFAKLSPSQWTSFEIARPLESNLVFLNKNYLSMNGLLSQVNLPYRTNVFVFPFFPPEFSVPDFDRQSRMLDKFVQDTGLSGVMRKNWTVLFDVAKRFPPPQPKDIEAVFEGTAAAVKKIKQRGGMVVFVRTPCSEPMWSGEQQGFPRDKFWNKLLESSGAPGIHFADYKETSSFICPEWSHLSPSDAVVYTTHLVRQIQEKGWKLGAANQNKSHVTKN
jgi:hypothetical protein